MESKIIDTHSHIYSDAFSEDRDAVIQRAKDVGVEKIMLPAVNSQSHDALFALSKQYSSLCFPMMGLHPTSINDNPKWKEELELVEKHLNTPPIDRFYAVGEIGLDLHWSRDFYDQQLEAFEYQIELSLKHDLPIVVHTRDAWEEMVQTLQKYKGRGVRGILHSFSGSARDYFDLNECGDFLFGISGVATYNNSDLPYILPQIPIEKIVLETDAPYLPPVPFRGKRNESSYLIHTCRRVAKIYKLTYDQVANITTQNANRMFF